MTNQFSQSKPVEISDYQAFSATDYLSEYYQVLTSENRFLLDFFHSTYTTIQGAQLIEIGGGPTVYQLISASANVSEITFTEYHPMNRHAVSSWLNEEQDCFNWDDYFKYVALLENVKDYRIIKYRLRDKITKIMHYDLWSEPSIQINKNFDIVSMNFCAESITQAEDQFLKAMDNAISLLKEKGHIVFSMAEGANYYKVGKRYFPAFKLTKDYINLYLKSRDFINIHINYCPSERVDYTGIFAILASKFS